MQADNKILRNPIAVSQKPYSPSPQQSHAAGKSTPASAGALSWGDLMWPASANERLYNHRLNVSNDDILRRIVVCHNHQNNLAEGSLVATTRKSLISDFFSFTHFVQAGTYMKVFRPSK